MDALTGIFGNPGMIALLLAEEGSVCDLGDVSMASRELLDVKDRHSKA